VEGVAQAEEEGLAPGEELGEAGAGARSQGRAPGQDGREEAGAGVEVGHEDGGQVGKVEKAAGQAPGVTGAEPLVLGTENGAGAGDEAGEVSGPGRADAAFQEGGRREEAGGLEPLEPGGQAQAPAPGSRPAARAAKRPRPVKT